MSLWIAIELVCLSAEDGDAIRQHGPSIAKGSKHANVLSTSCQTHHVVIKAQAIEPERGFRGADQSEAFAILIQHFSTRYSTQMVCNIGTHVRNCLSFCCHKQAAKRQQHRPTPRKRLHKKQIWWSMRPSVHLVAPLWAHRNY